MWCKLRQNMPLFRFELRQQYLRIVVEQGIGAQPELGRQYLPRVRWQQQIVAVAVEE